MKRSPLKRKAPLRATPNEAKAVVKTKECRACAKEFFPARSMQVVCGQRCAKKLVDLTKKAERDSDKARKLALRRLSDLEKDCRVIIQELARLRDRNDGCISCHMGPNYTGQWHGSHYRAHGNCSNLQMHLWNVHKACAQCNLHKHGNKEGFILGLLKKPGYGRERLEWLDSQPAFKRFDREYLLRFKEVMGKRLRRVKKAAKK
jgi:hypothetical protein